VTNDLETSMLHRLVRMEEDLHSVRVELDELLPQLRRAVAQINSLERTAEGILADKQRRLELVDRDEGRAKVGSHHSVTAEGAKVERHE
jgi:hypothetical protein